MGPLLPGINSKDDLYFGTNVLKIQELERGVTGIYGKGMYTKTEKLVLICATPRRDVAKIRRIAKQIDNNSFIIISNSREVYGEGFK